MSNIDTTVAKFNTAEHETDTIVNNTEIDAAHTLVDLLHGMHIDHCTQTDVQVTADVNTQTELIITINDRTQTEDTFHDIDVMIHEIASEKKGV